MKIVGYLVIYAKKRVFIGKNGLRRCNQSQSFVNK